MANNGFFDNLKNGFAVTAEIPPPKGISLGKSLAVAKEVGVDMIVSLAEKMVKTPEEKERKAIGKEIKELEKGLENY